MYHLEEITHVLSLMLLVVKVIVPCSMCTHGLIVGNPAPFITVTNGTNTGFSCDAESFPDPMYEWIHPNGLIVRKDVIEMNRQNLFGFNPTLFGDEGTYICRAFIIIDEIVYLYHAGQNQICAPSLYN